jgi:hypothetical protein
MCRCAHQVCKRTREVAVGPVRGLHFDHVFDEAAPQAHVYNTAISSLVDGVFRGSVSQSVQAAVTNRC